MVTRTPIRFYTDEHVARAVVRSLRQRGVDVLTVPEADLLGASDEEHLMLIHQILEPEDMNGTRRVSVMSPNRPACEGPNTFR